MPKIILHISGFPRSGTTLLESFINSSEEVKILHEPETCFSINKILGTRDELEGRKYFENSRLSNFLSYNEIISIIQNNENIEDLLYGKDYQVVGEKSLNSIFFADQIFKSFKNARIIYIRRNFYEVIASNLVKRGKVSVNLDLLFSWYTRIYAWEFIAQRMIRRYKDKCFIMSYEKLLNDPSSELKKVCQWLGIEYSKNILNRNGLHKIENQIKSKVAHVNLNKNIENRSKIDCLLMDGKVQEIFYKQYSAYRLFKLAPYKFMKSFALNFLKLTRERSIKIWKLILN